MSVSFGLPTMIRSDFQPLLQMADRADVLARGPIRTVLFGEPINRRSGSCHGHNVIGRAELLNPGRERTGS